MFYISLLLCKFAGHSNGSLVDQCAFLCQFMVCGYYNDYWDRRPNKGIILVNEEVYNKSLRGIFDTYNVCLQQTIYLYF